MIDDISFPFCDHSKFNNTMSFLGLEDYESIRREMYRDSDVILICFDIGHPPSLQSVVSKVF